MYERWCTKRQDIRTTSLGLFGGSSDNTGIERRHRLNRCCPRDETCARRRRALLRSGCLGVERGIARILLLLENTLEKAHFRLEMGGFCEVATESADALSKSRRHATFHVLRLTRVTRLIHERRPSTLPSGTSYGDERESFERIMRTW